MQITEVMRKTWFHLISSGMTPEGAAGLMGNLFAESGIIPIRVETLCLQRLRETGKYYTDAIYTAFVDDGTISRAEFLHPLPGKQYGYGLAQWTSPGRKSKLYDHCKARNVSIGDLAAQLDFLVTELQQSYPSVWHVLTTTDSIAEASDAVLIKFEMPKDTGFIVRAARAGYARDIYTKLSGGDKMTEREAIDKVLAIALAEVGYLEKSSAASLYNKTANAGTGNYTKFNKELHDLQPSNMDYPAAWCDAFVDWCFYKAFGADMARKMLCGTFDDYTVNSAEYYKRAGRWYSTPKRGDQVFFRNSGGICHTGIVYNVAGSRVYTIEGNKSNAVRKCDYSTTDGYIAGYGRPRYELVSTEKAEETKYTGHCTAKAVQLIKGDFGPAVKSLQAALSAHGYKGLNNSDLKIDGIFGDNTAHAVEALQRAVGMTGINFGTVSTLTWQALIDR